MNPKRPVIFGVQAINIEDVPDYMRACIYPSLNNNGGNCFSVDSDSVFGSFLKEHGFVFSKTWEWIVVFR